MGISSEWQAPQAAVPRSSFDVQPVVRLTLGDTKHNIHYPSNSTLVYVKTLFHLTETMNKTVANDQESSKGISYFVACDIMKLCIGRFQSLQGLHWLLRGWRWTWLRSAMYTVQGEVALSMSISVTNERSNPSTAASAIHTSGVSNLHASQNYGPNNYARQFRPWLFLQGYCNIFL